MKKKKASVYLLVLSILAGLFYAVPRTDQIMTLIDGKQTTANSELLEAVAMQQGFYRTLTLEETAPDLESLQSVTGVPVPDSGVVSYLSDGNEYVVAVQSGDQVIMRGFGGEARCDTYSSDCVAQVASSVVLQQAEPYWMQAGVPVSA